MAGGSGQLLASPPAMAVNKIRAQSHHQAMAATARQGPLARRVRRASPTSCAAYFEKKKFENEGDFWFMQPSIDMLFKPGKGKKIAFGVLTQDVDEKKIPSEDEQKRLREQASRDLTNIDADERERRRAVGNFLNLFSVGLGAAMVVLPVPPLARLGVAVPLLFAEGYLKSADTGL
eukprot:CAMPEP_0184481050 /NCGR_PEP_ID=MMETSP0113_2-20130426/2601_1 /TAXON_ID=91329 /ORGANISM="Norrisiella sphaerica, Strain BC52" /LENGTH=175 /DNA_ID=CAMNT_0026859949 /DNA_START=78 /DNA_END=605 /DNA_ORIENTATION=+